MQSRTLESYVRSNGGRVHPALRVHVVDGERGVVTLNALDVHEEVCFIPNDLIIFSSSNNPKDTISKLALKMSKQEAKYLPYFKFLPSDIKQFPIAWKDIKHPSLSALSNVRRQSVYEEYVRVKKKIKTTIDFNEYVYWRTIVGSRNFAKSQVELGCVPFADMLNASSKPNVNWSYNSEGFKMITTKKINSGEQLFDYYGVKTSVEWLMFYGCVPKKEIAASDRICYVLGKCIKKFENLSPEYKSEEPCFEFCLEQEWDGDGSKEILSLMRFAVSDKPKAECPSGTLNGYAFEPSTRELEVKALQLFLDFLIVPEVSKTIIKSLNDFVDLEREIIQVSRTRCMKAIEFLSNKKVLKTSDPVFGAYKSVLNNFKV